MAILVKIQGKNKIIANLKLLPRFRSGVFITNYYTAVKGSVKPTNYLILLVLQERIELSASPLPRGCSTTELLQQQEAGPRQPYRPSAQPIRDSSGSLLCRAF